MERCKTTPGRVGVANGQVRGPGESARGLAARGPRESDRGPGVSRSLSMERLTSSLPRVENPGSARPPAGPEGKEVKVLLLGPPDVGKSALVVRYLTKRYIGDYADCESICSGSTVWGYKQIKVHLLDTRGETKDSGISLQDDKLAWADGVLVVFSIADVNSYEQTKLIVDDLLSKDLKNSCAFVLVGHKSDLDHLREVPEGLGKRLAAVLNCPYIEASARESYGSTVNVFSTLFLEIKYVAKRRNKTGDRRTSSTVLHQIRDSLRCLTNEFRQRTNTF